MVDEFELTQEQQIEFLIGQIGNVREALEENPREELKFLPTDPFRSAIMVAWILSEESKEARDAVKVAFPQFIEECKEQLKDIKRAVREFEWIPTLLP